LPAGRFLKKNNRFPFDIWLPYSLAILYTLFIFATIPCARPFQKFVYDHYGRSSFGYVVLLIIALCLVGCVYYLIRNARRGASIKNYVWLAVVAGFYFYFTLTLWKCPEEAIHFLEYGLLSFLFYRALRHHVRDVTIYFTASFLVLFVGSIDEAIQWVVPDRVGSFRDVWINFLAGALFQLGLWKGIKPGIISETIQPGSVKILIIVITCCMILLGLCSSMMSQCKESRPTDPDKRWMYSQILDEHLHEPSSDFLKTYKSFTTPLLISTGHFRHEAR